jgi:RNase P/RNase MRP subunit p29
VIIGKTITITKAKNKSIEGKQGTVTDETKNTIKLDNITIIKNQIITIKENTHA